MQDKVVYSFDIGIKNLAVCCLRLGLAVPTVLHWEVLPLDGNGKQLDSISMEFYRIMDELIELYPPHIILLENQPAFKNPTMKSVQMIIFGYFQLRKHWEGAIEGIHFISATEKLRGIKAPTYRDRKKMAVEVARDLIRDSPELIQKFDMHKKKDDMADSLLQAVAWAQKEGLSVCKIA